MNNDLISRSELKKAFIEECCGCCDNCSHCMTGYKCELIDNAPTVEITEKQAISVLINSGWLVNHDKELREKWERPQGEWIERTERITLDTYYECSNCKEPWTTIEGTPWQNMMNFCPNCGALMKGGNV